MNNFVECNVDVEWHTTVYTYVHTLHIHHTKATECMAMALDYDMSFMAKVIYTAVLSFICITSWHSVQLKWVFRPPIDDTFLTIDSYFWCLETFILFHFTISVSKNSPVVFFCEIPDLVKQIGYSNLFLFILQTTQRLDLYASSLTAAIMPNYQPPIVRDSC